MKCCDDKTASWWDTTIWWNCELIKVQIDDTLSGYIRELIKYGVDEIIKFLKQQVHEIIEFLKQQVGKLGSWWNWKLMKMSFNEIASW